MSKLSSKEIIEDLYKQNFVLKDENGDKFEIPEEGSLGLLAIGYKGLIAWRKKKIQVRKNEK